MSLVRNMVGETMGGFEVVFVCAVLALAIVIGYCIYPTIHPTFHEVEANNTPHQTYNCNDHIVWEHFKCGKPYENITGLYCDGVIVCENTW